MSDEQPVVKRESGRMEMVRAFKYRGVDVLIRKWVPNVYEFLVAVNGQIFCDYYEAILAHGRGADKKNEELINQIVSNLSSSATATVDYHKERSSVRFKTKQFIQKLKSYVKQFRFHALQQKESAASREE